MIDLADVEKVGCLVLSDFPLIMIYHIKCFGQEKLKAKQIDKATQSPACNLFILFIIYPLQLRVPFAKSTLSEPCIS